jgi:hypothetical protein
LTIEDSSQSRKEYESSTAQYDQYKKLIRALALSDDIVVEC